MAQQTQIARVDEAWAAFMERYPDPRSLAQAPTSDVLRAWAGLGYNRRAVHLQRAAVAIEADHGGRVPGELDALEALPGVGPYTARAVAAIAYGRAVAAVDTNVRRVVARVTAAELSPRELQAEADAWVDPADPAGWTHASMELGAVVCVARRPRCPVCPVARWCASAGQVQPAPQVPGAHSPQASAARSPQAPFEHTTRWLRGRIVERLRELDDGAWTRLPSTIGRHDAAAVEAATRSLEREGLLERGPDGAVRLPSA
jgi:A/G-specific adenine glycosylase